MTWATSPPSPAGLSSPTCSAAPSPLSAGDFGTAHKAILTRDSLTLAAGSGDAAAVAERAAQIQRRMSSLTRERHREWQRLRGRAARLGGGVAILKIGSHSKPDLARRRAQAEKAFQSLPDAGRRGRPRRRRRLSRLHPRRPRRPRHLRRARPGARRRRPRHRPGGAVHADRAQRGPPASSARPRRGDALALATGWT